MSGNRIRTVIEEAQVAFTTRAFVKPLLLSTGPITGITEARAEATVTVNGKTGHGAGVVLLSDLWAWPDPALSHESRDIAMRGLCCEVAGSLFELCGGEAAHPLALGLRLHNAISRREMDAPALARLVCISPFDAAIHDAVGQALGRSAFDLYDEPVDDPETDGWFENADAAGAIRQTLQPAVKWLDAWLVVGKDDTEEELAAWIRQYGYHCFKLKLPGRDAAEDVKRTAEIYRWAVDAGSDAPGIAIDSNCANPDAASVLEYLNRLQRDYPEVYAALQYIEQPTGRDIARYPFDWRDVAALKPVMLDEGAVSLEALHAAREQGWSGVAIKTCRGHSFALLSAAWAHSHGMLLAMQDLTNPGIAAIHSALFGAQLPVMNGIELNSLQYIPEANADLLPRLRSLIEPTAGRHQLPLQEIRGLGSDL